jgi:hypothetical protein
MFLYKIDHIRLHIKRKLNNNISSAYDNMQPPSSSSSAFQCQQCKRKYKQVTNYNRHVAVCSLINSKTLQESNVNSNIFSDCEDLSTQSPSIGQLYTVVQHLATTVVQLQSKIAHLEQLAYIRKPKPDTQLLLMNKGMYPQTTFCNWITTCVVSHINRETLTDCIFRTPNLIDAMCKLVIKEWTIMNSKDLQVPIYADEHKNGRFFTYDIIPFSRASIMNANSEEEGEWRIMTSEAFRWTVNAIHRQILSEYHAWREECNDNSDEFIETSMRYGSIILGGNMDWSTLVTRFGIKLWSFMCETQRTK